MTPPPQPHASPEGKAGRPSLALYLSVASTSASRFFTAAVAFVSLALSARWLGPEGRGVAIVVTTWVGLFANLSHLSLGQICVHRAAAHPHEEWLGRVTWALVMITGAVTLGGWLVLAGLYAVAAPRLFAGIPGWALALGFIALPSLIWEQFGSALLSIIGQIRRYNLIQVVARSVGLIVLIVAIRLLGWGIAGFLVAFVVAQLAVSSAGLSVLMASARGHARAGLSEIGGLVRDGAKLHLNSIGMLLFSGVDIVMLQAFRGPAEAAVFQLANQLFIALLMVPQAAQMVLQSRVSGRSAAAFWREQRQVMAVVIGAMTLVAAVGWLAAPLVVRLVGGGAFDQSVSVLRILLVGIPGACFSTLMGIQWITRGYFLQTSLLTFATGAINVAMNVFLIPRYGAVGAATATVIGLYVIPGIANAILALRIQRSAARP